MTVNSSVAGWQRELADAEEWARSHDVTVEWSDDWEVGDHRKEYGEEAYEEGMPDTCEQAVIYVPCKCCGQPVVRGSVGCIDDATPEYRRFIEANLALEARQEMGEE